MITSQELRYPLSDLSLARRLERTEAWGNADFVETRARLFPDSGAQWIEVAGAYAMFDGPDSHCTQTFGLGVFDPIGPAELEQIEAFFRERNAPVFHEVSPLADPTLLPLLNERGYHPLEFTSVMVRPISRDVPLGFSRNEKIQARLIQEGEQRLWAETGAKGWTESIEFADTIREFMQLSSESGARLFLAELDDKPIATGALWLHDGIALFAGASTIPEARQQGAQAALLETRLRYAAEQGCDLAMMCAAAGSGSQRNAERQGFRIVYTRIKWQLTQTTAET